MTSANPSASALTPAAGGDPVARFLLLLPPRERYAHAALAALPRLLTLIDRHPLSRTYGSFDRSYWHYRTMDFPCGMSQEFVLPLALAHTWKMPGSEAWHGQPRLRELAVAGMHFARRSSHADGTCDDYFPFERAMGALVFSLYAMTEAFMVLGMREAPQPLDDAPALVEFFARRGDHLGHANETGRLANHQALAALALYNVYMITGEVRFRQWSDARRDTTLQWQSPEGWFQEYQGADPGYHSCSIDFLAKLRQKSNAHDVLDRPLALATRFARHFMHPDGSYAGEYGSRNTYHFYPHGFELQAARGVSEAREIADLFLERALPGGTRYFNDDDRMCAHYVYNWMQAWHDFAPRQDAPPADTKAPSPATAVFFPKAGLYVDRTRSVAHTVVNVRKGCLIKSTGETGCWLSDTGPMLAFEDGRVLVTHLMQPDPIAGRAAGELAGSGKLQLNDGNLPDAPLADSEGKLPAPIETNDGEAWCDLDQRELLSRGRFCRRKHHLANPWTQIAFRLMTLTVGRWNANLVRSTLQRILITGRKPEPWTFRRQLRFEGDTLIIVDDIDGPAMNGPVMGAQQVRRVMIGSDSTAIYVANSNTFQASTLRPPLDVPEACRLLNAAMGGRRTVRITRRYAVGTPTPMSLKVEAL